MCLLATAAVNMAYAAGSSRSIRRRERNAGATYITGPEKDVLIGPKFAPFYAAEKGTDLGVKSW
ncbi:MAG TPA: hypothetical protein VNA21_03320 [Steroidobacteraceae bacterium]|nr:hypothetical protein [Steroidobacteraceae bacterium]